MRIAVVGAGGVGGYFGAKLARAGESVVMLARGPHLDAIRRDGLRVRSAVEGELVAKVDAVESYAGQPPVDMALFCVKSFDTRSAAEALRPASGPAPRRLAPERRRQRGDDRRGAGRGRLGGAAYVFADIEAPASRAQFAGRSPSASGRTCDPSGRRACATRWRAPACGGAIGGVGGCCGRSIC